MTLPNLADSIRGLATGTHQATRAAWALNAALARSLGPNPEVTLKRWAGLGRYRRRYERIGRLRGRR